ncbi:MAG TPA: penicillin-binding protein 2 [Candidatus Kapabacteria bacterium]|nr:penicillin-binding protein 2 [Candidatus Kapabacteria bacterium]
MSLKILAEGSGDFAGLDRSRTTKTIVILIASMFILRIAYLQLIEGTKYKSTSDAQAIKRVRVEPFRGNIYDRNGQLIVHNEPSFSVTVTPYLFKSYAMPLLSQILDMDSVEIMKIINRYRVYSEFNPIKVYRDAPFEVTSQIEEYNEFLPGVEVETEYKRLYQFDGNMAHLLGYTREITQDQLKKRPYYFPGDKIGQFGLESTYENDLRGQFGTQYVAVNKFGQKVASFDNGSIDILPKNGFDLQLGIDIQLQELAEKLLSGKRGTVVAINPQDGSIIALASKPDYDPRDFSGKVPYKIYNALAQDKASPLLHRAIQSQYPPGSTWKMLIAIAAMQEGLIDEHTTIYCGGGLDWGGKYRKCHGAHGNVSVERAIQTSCNVFFYQLGRKIGIDVFEKYGKMFGFGQRTGIDLPGEAKGLLPTRAWLHKMLGNVSFEGRMVNYGIGQGEILTTPLQMAVYTAAIANEGTLFKPHIVRYIKNNITNKLEPLNVQGTHLPIKKEIFDIVKKGMLDVVNVPGGTASAAKLPDIQVCGKTGTAQNPHGQDHAWFVCFAPLENPKIAMAIFVENAGFGGAVSAPIAHKLLDAYFHGNYEEYKNPAKYYVKMTDSTQHKPIDEIPD